MDAKTKKTVEQNTKDINEIKSDIHTIKTNHLYHIEKDMERQTKQIEKMDMRIWWILGLLVTGIVIPALLKGL